MRYASRFALALILAAVCVPFALAGHYIEQQTHSDAFTMMGKTQPAKDSVQKIWMDGDKMASESSTGGMTIILRMDQKKIYFVNHAKKAFSVSPLPFKFPPEMEKMMAAFQFKTDVQKTGETRQIGPYNCQGALMTMSGFMNLTTKMWVTSDIKLPYENYYAMSTEMVAYSPAMREMMDKMRALGNVMTVEQEMTGEIMGAKTRTVTKLVAFKEMPVPADKFVPPTGYTEQPMDFQQIMSQQ